MDYYRKYITYKSKYLQKKKRKMIGGFKFQVGDHVKRISGDKVRHAQGYMVDPEAVGLSGIIRRIESLDKYIVFFPELSTMGPFGEVKGEVSLLVPEKDLILVVKFKVGDLVKCVKNGMVGNIWHYDEITGKYVINLPGYHSNKNSGLSIDGQYLEKINMFDILKYYNEKLIKKKKKLDLVVPGRFSTQDTTFKVGDRVNVYGSGPGNIIEKWAGSAEEKSSGISNLNKYKVKLDKGGVTWVYDTDLTKL